MTNTTDLTKQNAARWSVASASVLIALKLVVWLVSGSVSVLAEAIHSSADLIGSALALLSVRIADTPPDHTHTYGHGKFENVSGMFIALFILGAGALAVKEAVAHLHSHTRIAAGPGLAAAGVMAFSGLVNIIVSRRLLRVGKATDSPALVADGRNLQTDIFTAFGVVAGLLLTTLTGRTWIDPVVAMIVSVLVLWLGIRVARDSLMTLSDAALPKAEEDLLRTVLEDDARILSYHKLRTRKSGSHRHVDVHVQISDSMSLIEAHDITEEVEDKLRATLPNVHAMIHIEPYGEEIRHQRLHHPDDPRT